MPALSIASLPEILDPIWTKLQGWTDQSIDLLPNLAVAVIVWAAFGFISRYVRRIVHRLFSRMSENEPVAQVLGQLARVAVIGIGLFIALSVVGLDKTVTSLLAGVGVVGLALGFAFQDTAANLVSGLYMAVRRPIDTGDIIEVAGKVGTVERIELRSTLLRTFDGLNVFIPNKEIFQGVLVNYTRTRERRVDLEVGVAYDEDLERVREVALGALEGLEDLDPDHALEFYFTEFGDSSINFSLRFWLSLADQPNWLLARSEAIIRLKKAFDEEGITIPFPIRTLDFGADAVGGERLELLDRSA